MINWKKLLLPSIEKIIGLIIIFFVTSINTTMDATIFGFPYIYYSCEFKGVTGCNFSISFLILDILLIYFLICLAFYPKLIKLKEDSSVLNKILINVSNFIINLVIFVIISFIFLVIKDDILKQWLPYLLGFRNTRPHWGF